MRFFQDIRNTFATEGIYEHQMYSLSLKTVVILGHLGICSFCSLLYFIFMADNIRDFAESFYLFATCLFHFCVLLTLALKSGKIFELFEMFESEIERRKKFRSLTNKNINDIKKCMC